jgi:tetratricopeptide (TPR) repeat protein
MKQLAAALRSAGLGAALLVLSLAGSRGLAQVSVEPVPVNPPSPPGSPAPEANNPVDVRSRLHLADEYLREKRYAEALEIYRELDKSNPKDPRVRAGLKSCLLELKQYEELERLLRRELEEWPDDPSVLEQLGTTSARRGNRDEAIRWWRRILEVQDKSRGSFELVADLFARNRMLDEALGIYAQADSLFPGEFTRQKAALHETRFEYEQATKEYLNYLESNPSSLSYVEGKLMRIGESEGGLQNVIERVSRAAKAHDAKAKAPDDNSGMEAIFYRKLLGDLYLEAGNYDGAADQYLALAKDSPSQYSSLIVFGKRCQTDGAYAAAIRVFQSIVDKQPDARAVPSALTEIASCQAQLRRWDDALVTYDRLEKNYPETSYALSARSERARILLRGKGLPDEAEGIYRSILREDGPWGEADPQFGIAECALWKEDFTKAHGILNEIREREFSDDTRERALFEDGTVYLYEGNFTQADSLFKEVAKQYPKGAHVNDALSYSILVNTNPDDAETLHRYGIALHRLHTGRVQEAIPLLEALDKEKPKAAISDEVLLLLGRAQRENGNAQAAIAVLDRAITAAQVPDLAADSRLLKADILSKDLHQSQAALAEYEEILVNSPETLAADRAREEAAALRRALPQ